MPVLQHLVHRLVVGRTSKPILPSQCCRCDAGRFERDVTNNARMKLLLHRIGNEVLSRGLNEEVRLKATCQSRNDPLRASLVFFQVASRKYNNTLRKCGAVVDAVVVNQTIAGMLVRNRSIRQFVEEQNAAFTFPREPLWR